MSAEITAEDLALLQWIGWQGDQHVCLVGEPGARRIRACSGTADRVRLSVLADDVGATIYQCNGGVWTKQGA